MTDKRWQTTRGEVMAREGEWHATVPHTPRPPVSGEPPHEHRWAGPDNFAPYEYCSLCSVPRHHQHHVHEQRRVTDCAECVAAATDFLRPPVSGEPPCVYCRDTRWVEDENWSPDDPATWKGERSPGNGLIPCGGCNLGGWDVPVGSTVRPPVSGEPSDEHEHDWVDAPDDETGWYCPTCGVTEYPSDEHEQLANDLYCVAARPETIWWDDLPPEVQKGWIRAADLVKQRVDAARAEGALHGFREGAAQVALDYRDKAVSPGPLNVHALQDAMERTDGGPWLSDYGERVAAEYARLTRPRTNVTATDIARAAMGLPVEEDE